MTMRSKGISESSALATVLAFVESSEDWRLSLAQELRLLHRMLKRITSPQPRTYINAAMADQALRKLPEGEYVFAAPLKIGEAPALLRLDKKGEGAIIVMSDGANCPFDFFPRTIRHKLIRRLLGFDGGLLSAPIGKEEIRSIFASAKSQSTPF